MPEMHSPMKKPLSNLTHSNIRLSSRRETTTDFGREAKEIPAMLRIEGDAGTFTHHED